MTNQPVGANDEIIYLFTTAGEAKPTYRRGILDSLTYPTGHVQQFSYRRSDIDPLVNPRVSSVTDAKAVIVFVDMDEQHVPTYMPLRWVTLLDLRPLLCLDNDPRYDPEEKVRFFLQLEDYVEYQEPGGYRQWHESLRILDAAREARKGGGRYFVVTGPNKLSAPKAGQLSWENLVTAVSQSSRFRNAIFLRLNHLRPYGRELADVPLNPYGDGPRTYLLRPGQDYQLDFDIFVGSGTTSSQSRSPVVTLASSSELITTTRPFQSVVSGLVQQFTILSCKRTVEETRAGLSVEIDEPVIGVVNTPNPVLLLDVRVSRGTLVLFLVLVFFGSLLISSDKDVLPIVLGAKDLLVWLFKIAGSVCFAGAAYLAFRKLPSGQG
jgi:hypothetical protein